MDREAILQALFDRLAAAAGFASSGRRLQHWTQVDAQPALYLRHIKDQYPPRGSGDSAKVTVHAEAWVYCKVSAAAPDQMIETTLNGIVDAIEAVLAPAAIWPGRGVQNVQTLGRSDVEHCWIEGEIEFDTGDIDSQGKAVIPIAILVPQ